MNTLSKKLHVQFKFFGGVKPIDAQSFDSQLEEFRKTAYASIPEEHNNLRARYLIDCGIDSISNLLSNLWNSPWKLAQVTFSNICATMKVDNNYTAYWVAIFYGQNQFDYYESNNFEEAEETETEDMFQKYGFKEIPPKTYRVTFKNHVAVLSDFQLSELKKENPDKYFEVEEVKA